MTTKNMSAKEIKTIATGIATTLKNLAPKLHDMAISAVKLHFSNGDIRPIQQVLDCLEQNRGYRSDMAVWFKKYANVRISSYTVKHNAEGKLELLADFDAVPSFRAVADKKRELKKAEKEAQKALETPVVDEPVVNPHEALEASIVSAVSAATEAGVDKLLIKTLLEKLIESL